MSYFFHKASWTIDTNPERGLRLPLPVVFLVVPVLGAVFLMFLPVIGFILLGQTIAVRLSEFAGKLVENSMPLGAAIGEAHLTGAPPEAAKKETEEDPQDAKLRQLEREVASKRR